MIGEEFEELEEANRELRMLGCFGYYKLKLVAQQIEVISAEVEDMRKRNRRLGADTERYKQEKKLLKQVLVEAEEELTQLWSKGKCLEEACVEAARNFVAQEGELESTQQKFQDLQRDRALIVRQCSRLLSGHFKLTQKAQDLRKHLQWAIEWVNDLAQKVTDKNLDLMAQDLRIVGMRSQLDDIA